MICLWNVLNGIEGPIKSYQAMVIPWYFSLGLVLPNLVHLSCQLLFSIDSPVGKEVSITR
jgi:hypothetical protein